VFAALSMLTLPRAVWATSAVQYWNMPFASAFVEQMIAPSRVSSYNFFAHSMWFQHNPNGNDGMYIGLQQTGTSSVSRTAHFAIWNATAAYWAPPAQCANFGGEGVGKKCWITYPFTTVATIACACEGTTTTAWEPGGSRP